MSSKLFRNLSLVMAKNGAPRQAQQLIRCSAASSSIRLMPQRGLLLPPKRKEPNIRVVRDAFVPELVLKYSRLKYYLSKMTMLKLRWTWDRQFRERDFVEESKQAAVQLTDIVRLRDTTKINEFSTSNAYYQMANEAINFPHESCVELLRFRKQDIRQAVPIKVQLHNILGLKYAVIDVVLVGLRQVGDSETPDDLAKMKKALLEMEPDLQDQLSEPDYQLPYVFIELFMRFRRNYSNAEQISNQELIKHTNRWLVSVYKICRFNVFTLPPAI